MRPEFNPQVVEWLDRQPWASIWTTAICIFEARSGIVLLPAGRRRDCLLAGLDGLLSTILSGRILAFDLAAAERSAEIFQRRVPRGRNIGQNDTQIAGIAIQHKATLATRNAKDFDDLDIPLVDPWTA